MSPRESNPELSCRFQGTDAIRQAVEAARAFGTSQALDDDDLARLCIVVEELVANLYDHAELSEQDEVRLALSSDPGGIRLVLEDPGPPFDPWTAPPKLDQAERGGGAGIHLIRAWAQLVSYRMTMEGNRLELLLPIR